MTIFRKISFWAALCGSVTIALQKKADIRRRVERAIGGGGISPVHLSADEANSSAEGQNPTSEAHVRGSRPAKPCCAEAAIDDLVVRE